MNPPKPSTTASENVKVVVRVRPLSRKETERSCTSIINVDPSNSSVHVSSEEPKSFTFDAVFPQNSTQADIYNEVARPIVENVLQGYNGTIFAYGQTGTGKTFTMEGVYNVPELKGIIPNSFAQIFSHIGRAEQGNKNFLVRCSYLEIYNEEVRDLLITSSKHSSSSSSSRLEVKEHKDKGVYVKDLSSFVVRNADDMDRIMQIGNKGRSVASTNMNSVSSRSHAIFSITVECSMEHKVEGEEEGGGKVGKSFRVGKLNLVDLAGSERLSKTQATGDRLKEATKINLSLSNLGNVISALVEGSSHIPYRNSKLTRLLQDSLGGNSKTVMVANVGPADYNYDETVSTLRFANRAKNIKNHAVINEDPKDAMLRQFEKEILELRRLLEEDLEGGGRGGLSEAPDGTTTPNPDNSDAEVLHDLPEEALLGIKDELHNHQLLSSNIGSESQDRKSVISLLQHKVTTWKETEEQKLSLQQKLNSLQRKILIGGENLLDKSQAQEELLLRSMKEISLRKEEEAKLQSHLEKQEEERQLLEQKILSAEEQNLAVSRKCRKLWAQYQAGKAELDQLRLEQQEESEALVDEVHKLSRELQYHNQIIDSFIPPPYQKLIEKNVKWQPDSGEWNLKCVAYAGNNMTKGSGGGNNSRGSDENGGRDKGEGRSVDLSGFYLDLEDEFYEGGGAGGQSGRFTELGRSSSKAAKRSSTASSRKSKRTGYI